MINDYLLLATRNLRRRGIRSWLTLIGILIGITAVVALISLGDGLRAAVNSQFGVGSTNVITIQAGGLSAYGPPGTGVVNPVTIQDAEAIDRLGSIEVAIPRNIETVKMEYNNQIVIGMAGSLPDDKDKRDFIYENLDVETISGHLLEDSDVNKILVGNDFADPDKNGFGKEVRTGDTLLIQGKNFQVEGILEKKGSFIIDRSILIKDSDLKKIANTGDNVDLIVAFVKDKDLMEKAETDIEKLLRKTRDVKVGEEDFQVATPAALLQSVNQILLGVQIFIVLIASISIFVGAVGIVNTMTTSVLERKKEIGIMKAIGAKNSDVFYQFFFEAGLLGLIGGIIGVIFGASLGYLGTLAINSFLGSLTVPKINIALIAATLTGSFLIGAISGIVPALRAAKLNPVDALRS